MWMIRMTIIAIFRIYMAYFLPIKFLLTVHHNYTARQKIHLIQRGDVSTGWSMGWKVNWWAKMLDGNHAYKLIQNQLRPLVPMKGAVALTIIFLMHIRLSRLMAILVALQASQKC